MTAFGKVVDLYEILQNDYELVGFHQESELLNNNYQEAINKFESEYEI